MLVELGHGESEEDGCNWQAKVRTGSVRDLLIMLSEAPSLLCLHYVWHSYLFCDGCILCPLNPADDKNSTCCIFTANEELSALVNELGNCSLYITFLSLHGLRWIQFFFFFEILEIACLQTCSFQQPKSRVALLNCPYKLLSILDTMNTSIASASPFWAPPTVHKIPPKEAR